MVRVVIKWGKAAPMEVDLNPGAPVADFKQALYELTGVPVATQKLMTKSAWKGTLKDDASLAALTIPEGTEVVLMGSSTGIPEKKAAVVFLEDMTAAEAVKAGATLPAGLRNVGNTCYMASTLQCLRGIPELVTGLRAGGYGAAGPDASIASSLNDLYGSLAASADPLFPHRFWAALKARYAQFGETSEMGMPKQQDSEEFQSALLTSLSETLRAPVAGHPTLYNGNLIDQLFGVELTTTMKCGETDAEPVLVRKETNRKVVCNIEGGAGSTVQINHLLEGIKLALTGTVELRSDVLGRNATWSRSSLLSRLPKYLCVQMLRFYWKPTPDSREHAGVKCKMLRPVAFPADNLDLFELCTPEVQALLRVARDKADAPPVVGGAVGGAGSADMTDDGDLASAIALSMGGAAAAPNPLADAGLPPTFKGVYECFAVVTHQGRSADVGHYIGWVRAKGDTWLCFNDDIVVECRTEDILALKGGGDYDMASMLFYRAKPE